MNSFISWIGGKHLLKKEIYKRFPRQFNKYIEVFGGAAWVLFYKEHKGYEVYNDYNSELVNLFKIVKYHTPELQRELQFTLNSRQLFLEMRDNYNVSGLTDIQRASRFFLLIKQSYASKLSTYGCVKKDINLVIKNLDAIQQRLSTVIIENKDFEDLIKTYDSENTFFYLDPPYYNTEKYYQVKFTKNDHVRLYETLKNIKGKFLLSYNNCEYITNLYREFKIETLTRQNNLSISKNSNYDELLISNYMNNQIF